ncbi:MAG: FAD-binding oxidoreductase [Oscillospiraceae bacterium]|nr:FAD-binding oxidoreductase [Oscillospiraceae bacterium]
MKSVWQETTILPTFPELNGEIHADVLVIGGGIAGILTAYFLHQTGVNYLLVEKEKICSGTTQNTTAKITCQHGLIYQKIVKNYGIETAQKYLSVNQKAFRKYTELCQNIDCDFEYQDNYVYSIDDRHKLESEINVLQKIGCPVQFCEKLPLPFAVAGAVKFPDQAQFHPCILYTYDAADD